MWKPDDEYVQLHAQFVAISGSIENLHQRLADAPTKISNRRDAIGLLRNLDAAFAGFRIDASNQSTVQKAANLSDCWQQTFDQTVEKLKAQIATLNQNIADLSPLEEQQAELEVEEKRLKNRQDELETLETRATALPGLIEHRKKLEEQIEQLQNEQRPELVKIEDSMTTMRLLLDGAAENIANATAIELEQAQKDRAKWLQQQHDAEKELANLNARVLELTSKNERVRDEIQREQETTNSIQEEHQRLVKEHQTHLELNRELNAALIAHGHADGVEAINETIEALSVELTQLDSGLQKVLQIRQDALSRQGKNA